MHPSSPSTSAIAWKSLYACGSDRLNLLSLPLDLEGHDARFKLAMKLPLEPTDDVDDDVDMMECGRFCDNDCSILVPVWTIIRFH